MLKKYTLWLTLLYEIWLSEVVQKKLDKINYGISSYIFNDSWPPAVGLTSTLVKNIALVFNKSYLF